MKVRGTITACARLVRASRTGRECVGYHVIIERTVRAPYRLSLFDDRSLTSEGRCADFELQPKDGAVIFVRASAFAEMALRKDVVDAVDRERAPEDLRYREGVIGVGDSVVVWGEETLEIAPELPAAGYREPPMRRVIAGDAAHPVLVSNLPGAGLVDEAFSSRRQLLRRMFRRGKRED